MAAHPAWVSQPDVFAGPARRHVKSLRAVGLRASGVPLLQRLFLGLVVSVLAGYALLGKTFAYIAVGPIYIGDVTLLFGLVGAFLTLPLLRRVARAPFRSPIVLAIVAVMAWGAVRTAPYIGRYGIDSLRDAALWGYGLYGILVFAIFRQYPAAQAWAVKVYKRFAYFFPAIITFLLVGSYGGMVILGVSVRDLSALKPGDVGVHLAGCACFGLAGWDPRQGFLRGFWVVAALLFVAVSNRGGLLAFSVAVALVMLAQRRKKVLAYVALVLAGLLALPFLTPLLPTETVRRFTPQQLVVNIESIFVPVSGNAGNVDATRRWRLLWWKKIVGYTVEGPYRWTGKGYGVNLANSDGFQVVAAASGDPLLRSPHDVQMTFLARSGLPGLALWLAFLGVLGAEAVSCYRRAMARGEIHYANLFLFLAATLCAFVVNASFDVFLEGPMGGVWFWCLCGLLAAALGNYRDLEKTGLREARG